MMKIWTTGPWPTRRLALAGLGILLAGCTVQPLYQSSADMTAPSSAPLTNVAVNDASDRITQQVRNRLLFLLHRGGGGAVEPDYQVELNVSSSNRGVFRSNVSDGSANFTSQRITMSGTLTLTDLSDGSVLARETRAASASFENTTQEFANLRALRDAENRAASELAEQFRIVIAAALANI